jgi:hypothetical protein
MEMNCEYNLMMVNKMIKRSTQTCTFINLFYLLYKTGQIENRVNLSLSVYRFFRTI